MAKTTSKTTIAEWVRAQAGRLPTEADVSVAPALDYGTEGQPTLAATGSLAAIRLVVADADGVHAVYRIEAYAHPAGHGGDPASDALVVVAGRVPLDARLSAARRASGRRDVAEPPGSVGPADGGGVAFAWPASGPGRLLRHEAPTGRTECLQGCGAEHAEGVAVAGDDCPGCGAPLSSVLGQDGRTHCPRPCGVHLHDEADLPVGSACPVCLALLADGGALPDPYEAMGGMQDGEDGEDGEDAPCPWCGRDGGQDQDHGILEGIAALADARPTEATWRTVRDLALRASACLDDRDGDDEDTKDLMEADVEGRDGTCDDG